MTAIIGTFILTALAGSMAFILTEVRKAPEGYEDENGFQKVHRFPTAEQETQEEQEAARWAA